MKIVTAAVAADRLGWSHRFVTRLHRTGTVSRGVLDGDLIVTGGGDPSIAAQDLRTAPLFEEWADLLRASGIDRIEGRLIGDDDAFPDEPLGAGWAWDYLAAGYAAPSGALSYNENVGILRVEPGPAPGTDAIVTIGPPGHGLVIRNLVATGSPESAAALTVERLPGHPILTVRGSLPVASSPVVRTASIDNPTLFFVEGFRQALADRGIVVTGGATDIDMVAAPAPAVWQTLATHESLPLSSLAGYMMKVSQNFYGDMLLKSLGEGAQTGSAAGGAATVRATLDRWGIDAESLVMYDGSGLSRYNYASARLLTDVLAHVWRNERLRGPFAAALPVSGHDGTLAGRMQDTRLERRVQAKTGTISNVRALAGYLRTEAGEDLAFAMIANNVVATNAAIDAVMERALEVLASGAAIP